jgi:hypothetical protein
MTKKIVYVIVVISLLISPVFAEEKTPSKAMDQEQIDELAAKSDADPTRQGGSPEEGMQSRKVLGKY